MRGYARSRSAADRLRLFRAWQASDSLQTIRERAWVSQQAQPCVEIVGLLGRSFLPVDMTVANGNASDLTRFLDSCIHSDSKATSRTHVCRILAGWKAVVNVLNRKRRRHVALF